MPATRGAFVAAMAASLSSLAPSAALAADEPALTPLRVASAPDDDVTPVLYAEKTGMFRDVGLDVQATALSNGTAVAAAVIGGAIDMGKASLLSVISAHVRGVPFAIVAPSGMADVSGDYSGLLVLKDSPYHNARDLNGQTVSVPALHDIQSLATQELIDKRGGDSKTIAFIEEPVTAVAATLDTNRVAAGVVTNPNLARAMATGKYRSLGKPIEEGFNGLMISAWLSTADWATKNASVVQRFGQVVIKASAYAMTHHADTVDVIAAFSGIDRATVATMTRAVYATQLNPALVQPLIDAAARYGAIPKPFPAAELFSPVAYGYKR